MFEAAKLMYFYCETPLHAGAGRTLGSVDLPIQRERVTGWPMIQAGGIKGKLRACAGKQGWVTAVFGPETENASDHAGALAPGDARLLLFPVRSLTGVFAWVTCPAVLNRLARDYSWTTDAAAPPPVLGISNLEHACVTETSALTIGNDIVLEDVALTKQPAAWVNKWATWLAEHAFPEGDAYKYWRTSLPARLAVVHDDTYRDFVLTATEIQTHIKIDQDRKTVQEGALWTAEYLPVDSVLYSPLTACAARDAASGFSAQAVLEKIRGMALHRMQLGGDETTGHGIVGVRMQA